MAPPRTLAVVAAAIAAGAVMLALLALALSSGAFVANVVPKPSARPAPMVRPTPPAGAKPLHELRKQAVSTAQKRLQKESENPRAWAELGQAYMSLARATGDRNLYADAEPALRRALELSSAPDPFARRALATCLLLQLRLKETTDFVDESAKLFPQDAAFVALLGDLLLAQGSYEEAAKQFALYEKLEGGSHANARLAHLEMLHGNWARARELLQACTGEPFIDPESPAWLCVQLGLMDLNTGNLESARQLFGEALQWAPQWPYALLPSARCEELLGDIAASRGYLNEAHKVSRTAEVMLPLARIEGAMGNANRAALLHSEALRLLQVRLTMDDKAALRPFALALLHAGAKPEAALEYAAQDVALRDDIYSCAVLAWARSANGLHKEALEALARALRLGTRDATLWLIAERIYRAASDTAKADEALKRAHEINPFTKGREAQWLAGWR